MFGKTTSRTGVLWGFPTTSATFSAKFVAERRLLKRCTGMPSSFQRSAHLPCDRTSCRDTIGISTLMIRKECLWDYGITTQNNVFYWCQILVVKLQNHQHTFCLFNADIITSDLTKTDTCWNHLVSVSFQQLFCCFLKFLYNRSPHGKTFRRQGVSLVAQYFRANVGACLVAIILDQQVQKMFWKHEDRGIFDLVHHHERWWMQDITWQCFLHSFMPPVGSPPVTG